MHLNTFCAGATVQDFQAKRGGRTTLGPINSPQGDYAHDKGDALYALELTLGFEKVRHICCHFVMIRF